MDIRTELKDIVQGVANQTAKEYDIAPVPEVIIEAPKDKGIADLSTNIAMQICKAKKGTRPLDIATRIVEALNTTTIKHKISVSIERIEVKPPGFINFYISKGYLRSVIGEISNSRGEFGRSKIGASKRVLIEFVSANPTGPLSVAHGRQAAVGDVIANILEFNGYDVKREYYLNDEGNQINILGESIYARYCELLKKSQPFPEEGYRGSYIYEIAEKIIDKHGKALDWKDGQTRQLFCDFGIGHIMDMINKDLADFGVKFDNYFSQHKMTRSDKIEKALRKLEKKGFVYERDGALWLASESKGLGDDKDRVLKKSDRACSYTYLAPDIAYHEDKFSRGFDWLIDLWGPDHHGYMPRLNAANKAMGRGDDALSLLIVQLATISRAGKPVAMSTREGEFITLREVIDEVGKDVARFFFLMRRKDSHLDFDLELAKSESMENPVYYIQYAHARICGILEYKKQQSLALDKGKGLELIDTEEEFAILRILREFPHIIEWSGKNLEPHKLILYLMELSSTFHVFYTKHRVVNEDKDLTAQRLLLVEALKTIFSKALSLLGVSCPEKM